MLDTSGLDVNEGFKVHSSRFRVLVPGFQNREP